MTGLFFIELRHCTHVEFRIDGVEVFAVQIVLYDPQGFAEPLEMHDFTFAEEF